MDFLDSLLEKIPIIRDMDKKKRILAAGFVVFAVVSILGILIDAIAEAGGVVALVSVAIGFLLMAALIIADFFMSRKGPKAYPPADDHYDFFDDQKDSYGQQDDNSGYRANDGPDDRFGDELSEVGFDSDDDGRFRDDRGFDDNQGFVDSRDDRFRDDRDLRNGRDGHFRDDRDFRDGRGLDDSQGFIDNRDDRFRDARDFRGEREIRPRDARDYFDDTDDRIEYSVTPDPTPAEPDREPQRFSRSVPSRFDARIRDNDAVGHHPAFDDDVIGKPVMTFEAPSAQVSDQVRLTADTVAPDIPAPVRADVIGGPVMSIPFRGSGAPEVSEQVAPKQEERPPVQAEIRPAAPDRSARGQEIESFFDHMSDDELLYSDCVEVWASDAKPAAIRLLKQVESLTDTKIADSLGREAEYVNAMLDRIYYFTMLDSIKDNLVLKKYNFSGMVKECLRRFSPFFMEKRIGLLWKGLDIDIVTDKRWLIFALTQVVFNAVEFTGLGGKIAISARKEGSMIHLMVDDSGCGISDEDLPHIFMAGFMGDNAPNDSGRRTGMGLFITRSVIEKLGGSVTAESTEGKGTRITMILPEKL